MEKLEWKNKIITNLSLQEMEKLCAIRTETFPNPSLRDLSFSISSSKKKNCLRHQFYILDPHMLVGNHRRRVYTDEKAKVVAAV